MICVSYPAIDLKSSGAIDEDSIRFASMTNSGFVLCGKQVEIVDYH